MDADSVTRRVRRPLYRATVLCRGREMDLIERSNGGTSEGVTVPQSSEEDETRVS